MYKDIINKIATEANISKCFSLEEIGIDNYAFPYQQAILLVDVLRQSNVSILGGDVYLKRGSSIDISYDNWFAIRKKMNRIACSSIEVAMSLKPLSRSTKGRILSRNLCLPLS